MKYEDFLRNMHIYETSAGRGKGVRCNICIYMYPDGHGNLYFGGKDGYGVGVGYAVGSILKMIKVLIDIVNKMHERAKDKKVNL